MRTIEDITAEMQTLVAGADAENRSLSDEEVTNYEALEAELQAVRKDQEVRSRHSAYTMPVTSNVQTAAPKGDDTLERAFESYLRTGQKNMDIAELRAQGTAPDTAGGYLVPEGFRARLIEQMNAFGGFMAAAENITTESGNPITWPTIADEVEAEIVAEHATGTNGADVVFGTGTLGAYKYMSLGAGNLPLRVSVELLQDSAFDINALLERVLGRRIRRAMNTDMVNGSGTNEPLGIMVGAGAVTATTTGTVTYGDLLDLVHAVDPEYRDGASWLFNDNTLHTIRGLVDGNNRPLWLPSDGGLADSLAGGRLLGFPVIVDQAVADNALGAEFAAFGNFREAYIVRRVRDITLVVDPYSRAANGEVQYTAWARADGTVQNANAFARITGA